MVTTTGRQRPSASHTRVACSDHAKRRYITALHIMIVLIYAQKGRLSPVGCPRDGALAVYSCALPRLALERLPRLENAFTADKAVPEGTMVRLSVSFFTPWAVCIVAFFDEYPAFASTS